MNREKTATPSPHWKLRLLRAGVAIGGRIAPARTAKLLTQLFFTPRHTKTAGSALRQADSEYIVGSAYLRCWEGDLPAVMLLHGWEGHYTQFEAMIKCLLGAGYTVITVDPPAHGDSPGRVSHPGRFADALHDAVASEGMPLAVVGHSMGAGAALLATKRGLSFPRMVLIASPASFGYVIDGFLGFVGLQGRGRERFHELVEQQVGHPLDAINAALLAPVIGDTPVLVVHDRCDRFIPYEQAQRLRAGLRCAQLHETHGLGHRRLLADKAVITRVLDFLSEQSPADREYGPPLPGKSDERHAEH